MSARRAIVGVCMVCALLVSAIAAQGASAVGTTAFTCKEQSGVAGFSKAHCKAADAVASGAKFVHVEVPAGTVTEISATNEGVGTETKTTQPAVLSVTAAGATITITCTKVSATGTQTNVKGPPMSITGTTEVKYTGCTVSPSTCTVTEPIIAKANVASVHTGTGETQKGLVFTGSGASNLFTSITLSGASCPLPGTFNITGKAVGRVDGATITFNKGEDELKLGAFPADLQSVITVKGRANSSQAFTPLSITTTAE